jgi:hypothetical protein
MWEMASFLKYVDLYLTSEWGWTNQPTNQKG